MRKGADPSPPIIIYDESNQTEISIRLSKNFSFKVSDVYCGEAEVILLVPELTKNLLNNAIKQYQYPKEDLCYLGIKLPKKSENLYEREIEIKWEDLCTYLSLPETKVKYADGQYEMVVKTRDLNPTYSFTEISSKYETTKIPIIINNYQPIVNQVLIEGRGDSENNIAKIGDSVVITINFTEEIQAGCTPKIELQVEPGKYIGLNLVAGNWNDNSINGVIIKHSSFRGEYKIPQYGQSKASRLEKLLRISQVSGYGMEDTMEPATKDEDGNNFIIYADLAAPEFIGKIVIPQKVFSDEPQSIYVQTRIQESESGISSTPEVIISADNQNVKAHLESLDGIGGESSLKAVLSSPIKEGQYLVEISAITDKAGNQISGEDVGTIIVQERNDQHANPTRPDESLDIYDSSLAGQKATPFGTIKIAIIKSGYWAELKDLLAVCGEAADYVAPQNFTPALVQKYPILLIPSAGLSNLSTMPGFRDKLTEYVSAGGTLVVLTQPTSDCYQLLPGQVESLGYFEDKACYTATAGIRKYNQALAGQTDATVNGTADGVLTAWPANAETWLYRIKNNFPALLSYPAGQGRVIVSNYYSDYAHGHSQLHEDERRLLRDLLSWGRDFGELPEIQPGGKVTVNVPVRYAPAPTGATLAPAAKVKLILRTPDRKAVQTEEIAVDLAADSEIVLPLEFNDIENRLSAGAANLGIWWINYEIIGATGQVVQAEYEGQRVALSKHLMDQGGSDLSLTVNPELTSALEGTLIPFRIIGRNDGDASRNISYKIFAVTGSLSGQITQERQVGSGSLALGGHASTESSVELIPFKAYPSSIFQSWDKNWWRFEFRDETGQIAVQELRGVSVYKPAVQTHYDLWNQTTPNATVHKPGEKVRLDYRIENLVPVGYPVTWDLSVHAYLQGEREIYHYSGQGQVEPVIAESLTFIVPEDCQPDKYYVNFTVRANDAPIPTVADRKGASSSSFALIIDNVRLGTDGISIDLRNIGKTDEIYNLTCRFAGGRSIEEYLYGVINHSEIQRLLIPIKDPTLFIPNSKMNLVLKDPDSGKQLTFHHDFGTRVNGTIQSERFDRSTNKLIYDSSFENQGLAVSRVQMNVLNPDGNVYHTVTLPDMVIGQTVDLLLEIPLPAEPGAEFYPIRLAISHDNYQNEIHQLAPKLELRSSKASNQGIIVELANNGTLDADYQYNYQVWLNGVKKQEGELAGVAGASTVQERLIAIDQFNPFATYNIMGHLIIPSSGQVQYANKRALPYILGVTPRVFHVVNNKLQYDFQIENTGSTEASNIKFVMETASLGFQKAMEIPALAPGETIGCQGEYALPEETLPGTYQLTYFLLNTNSVKTTPVVRNYTVSAPRLNVTGPSKTQFIPGEQYTLTLTNQGDSFTRVSYELLINDQRGVKVAKQSGVAALNPNQTESLIVPINSEFASAQYFVNWKVSTTPVTTNLDGYQSFTVQGAEASLTVITDQTVYRTDQNILAQARPVNGSQPVNGNLELSVQKLIRTPGERIDQWPCIGGNNQRTGLVKLSGRITKPDTKWINPFLWGQFKLLVGDMDGDGYNEIVDVGYDAIYFVDGRSGFIIKSISYADIYQPYPNVTGALLYDINNDGLSEVIVCLNERFIAVINGRAEIIWTRQFDDLVLTSQYLTAADLNKDGVSELLLDNLVLNASTGTVLKNDGTLGTVGDVNNDGKLEIVSKEAVFDANFKVLATRNGGEIGNNYPILADIDNDGFLEIILSDSNNLYVYNEDYSLLWTQVVSDLGKVVCGDINNDGTQELIVSQLINYDLCTLNCYSYQGNLLWRYHENDLNAEGMVLNDIDGDGNLDLIVGTWSYEFYIFNAQTGERTFHFLANLGTSQVFPNLIIADIDGDHESEIIGTVSCIDSDAITRHNPAELVLLDIREEVSGGYGYSSDYHNTYGSNPIVLKSANGTLFFEGYRGVFYYNPNEGSSGLIPVPDYFELRETSQGIELWTNIVKNNRFGDVLVGKIDPNTLQFTLMDKEGKYEQQNQFQIFNGKFYNYGSIDGLWTFYSQDLNSGEIKIYECPEHVGSVYAVLDDNTVITSQSGYNIPRALCLLTLNTQQVTPIYYYQNYSGFSGSIQLSDKTILLYGTDLVLYNMETKQARDIITVKQMLEQLGESYHEFYQQDICAVGKDDHSIYFVFSKRTLSYLYSYDLTTGIITPVTKIIEYGRIHSFVNQEDKLYYLYNTNEGLFCFDKVNSEVVNQPFPDNIKTMFRQKSAYFSKIITSPDRKIFIPVHIQEDISQSQLIGLLAWDPNLKTWQWYETSEMYNVNNYSFGKLPEEFYVFQTGEPTGTGLKQFLVYNLNTHEKKILDYYIFGNPVIVYEPETELLYYRFDENVKPKYLEINSKKITEIFDPNFEWIYYDGPRLIGAKGEYLYFTSEYNSLWGYHVKEQKMTYLSHSELYSYNSHGGFLDQYFDPNEGRIYVYQTDDGCIYSLDINPIIVPPSNNDIYDYTGTAFHEETVAQTVLPVSLAPGESKDLNHDFGAFTDPGSYTLKGRLLNQNGQLLAEGRSQFIVNNSGLGVMVNAARFYYRPGENFTIDGGLINASIAEAGGLKLTVTKTGNGQTTVLKEEDLTLTAGENRPYQLSFTADTSEGQYLIETKLEQNGVLMAQSQCLFEVVKPALTIEAETPGTVGSQPFDVRLKLANTCPLPIELQVNSSLLQLAGPLSLAANESTEIIRQLTLSSDAILDVSVTGDLTQQYQREIRYAASVATISLPERLSDAVQMISYNLFNPSQIQVELQLNLTLYRDGQLASEEILPVLLAPGQFLQGDWLVNLTPGNYRLVYSWGNQRRELIFICLPDAAATLAVVSEDLGPDQIKLTVQTANQGYQAISGTLEIRSDFAQQTLPVVLAAGAEETNEITLENLPATPGNYEIKITFLRQDLQLAERTVLFTREADIPLAPEMILGAEILTATGGAGQELPVTVTVKNSGTKAGDAIVALNTEPLTAEPAVLHVEPGAVETVGFQLLVPDDYESGTYQGKVLINGTAYPFQYQVNGYKLQVEASLDKAVYQKGETATLVLNTQNLGGQSELPLTVRVKHGEFDETREIVINDAASLVFALPAEDFNQKIFYGFYHSHTGRSLFLNVHNIYEALPELSLTTDKQTYQAGETVQVSVAVNQEGWLALTGPGDFYRFEKVSGVTAYSIPLPSGLRTGTYSIWAAFAEKTLEYRIDVRGGADLRFVSGKLDQETYRKNQPFRLDVIINSGSALNCTAALELVRPDGTADSVASQVLNLIAGENTVQFKGGVNSAQAGTHWMHVKLHDGDRPLSIQNFAFHCGQEELLAIITRPAQYYQGNEPVDGELHLYGVGSGTVIVSLDETPVLTVPVTLNGATTVPFTISGEIRPGQHQLTAVYQGAGTTGMVSAAFDYGIGLPDLQVQTVIVAKERTAAGAIPIQITIRKGRALPATEIPVSVKIGEQQIASYTIPALTEENESHQQTVLWDSGNFQGAGTVTVDVNPQRSIKEYDDQNNTGAAQFLIPKIPEAGGLPAVTNDPNLRITGSATPESLVLLYNGQGIVDFGFADGGGSFTLANVVLAQGENKLRFMAKSNDGWTSLFSPELQVIVDAAPPEISAANLSDGQHLNYEVVPEIIITEENPVEITYLLDNQPWAPGTMVASEGIHQLWVQVDDLAGNQTQFTLTFIIDRTLPEVMIGGVEDGFFYNHDVTPLVSASDSNPLTIESFLNGEPYQSGLIVADGAYQLAVTATDQAGNTADQLLEFVVDKTKPVIQVTGIVPDGANQAPVTPQIEITEVNPAETGLWLDGKPYTIGTAIAEEGWHELKVVASDKAGNSELVVVRFEIRNQPPAKLDYAILCKGIQVRADVKIQSVMAFGPVAFVDGDSRIDYLGTSETAVERNKQTKITKIETKLPVQSLPDPDWAALTQATQLRTESKINTKITMSNVRFENDLWLENDQMKVTGLLVVKGDLTLKGEMKFGPIAIFCTGKVTIISDAHVNGLIYAGNGAVIDGDSKVNGTIVSNAGVTVLGDLRCQKQDTPYDDAWWSR